MTTKTLTHNRRFTRGWWILFWLDAAGPSTRAEIADGLALDLTDVNGTFKQLVALGDVQCTGKRHDQRGRPAVWSLTKQGQSHANALRIEAKRVERLYKEHGDARV